MLLRVVEAALVTESGAPRGANNASDGAGRITAAVGAPMAPSGGSMTAAPLGVERPEPGPPEGALQLLRPLPASFASQLRPDGGHDPNSPHRARALGFENAPFLASDRSSSSVGIARSSSSGGASGFAAVSGNGMMAANQQQQWRQVAGDGLEAIEQHRVHCFCASGIGSGPSNSQARLYSSPPLAPSPAGCRQVSARLPGSFLRHPRGAVEGSQDAGVPTRNRDRAMLANTLYVTYNVFVTAQCYG